MKKESKKPSFLKAPKGARKLTASDLPPIVDHYQEKYKVKIVVNGEGEYGKPIIKQHDDKYEELIRFRDNPLKYALFIQQHWCSPTSTKLIEKWDISPHKPSCFRDDYLRIKNLIQKFLDKDGNLLDLNQDEIQSLNSLITTSVLKYEIDRQIKNQPEELNLKDQCLTREQVFKEITDIQKSLDQDKENKQVKEVGYVYTNNHRIENAHFEVFIIDKDNTVIKPVVWPQAEDNQLNLVNQQPHKFASADISDFVDTVLNPQAKFTGVCATLGMLYLKELLKDDAKQLKEFSLVVPFYDQQGKESYLFIPSPNALRYSHSASYNAAIEAMVASDSTNPIDITHRSKTINITPLRAILENTKKEAQSKNNMVLVEECESLLKKLPAFRDKWVEENIKAKQQRTDMLSEMGDNLYLNYKSSGFKDRSEAFKQQKLSENSQALFAIKKQPTSTPIKLDSYVDLYQELEEKRDVILDDMLGSKNFDLRPISNLVNEMRNIAKKFEETQDYDALDKNLTTAVDEVKKMQEISEKVKQYGIDELADKIKAGAFEYYSNNKPFDL